jgi:hypothetical protein
MAFRWAATLSPPYRRAKHLYCSQFPAYVLLEEAFLFAISSNHAGPTLAVFRLGGHKDVHESAWSCAAREVYEEAAVRIQPLMPPATYWLDGDCDDADVQPIPWPIRDSSPVAPLLVVSVQRTAVAQLSVMYLARAVGKPMPSAEIRGLLFLRPREIHLIAHQPVTLGSYLGAGGGAMLHDPLDEEQILEPFLQVRALSCILEIHQNDLLAHS